MSNHNSTLTQARLKELLNYDPETGAFTWLVARGPVKAGDIAGCVDPSGYLRLGVEFNLYWGHRLAWLYMTGSWPLGEVDHKDLNRFNTAWKNLRDGTKTSNIQNSVNARKSNALGVLGVTRNRKRFSSSITVNRIKQHLGTFSTIDEAHQVYLEAKRRLHVGCLI